MIGHFAEYYLKTNFVIDCRDCGTNLVPYLGKLGVRSR